MIKQVNDREKKIAILQALASGQPLSAGRLIPSVYCRKFANRKELLDDLKTKYGVAAKLFTRNGKFYIISDQYAYWPMFEENGLITHGKITFTRDEYEQFCSEKDENSIVWHETKIYEAETTVMHWQFCEGCEPIVEHPEGIPDQIPVPAPVKQVKKHEPIPKETPEPIPDEPEPERPKVIKLSTWKPNQDEERREKMNNWQNINREFL
jgi:hypothetical protein